MSTLSSLVTKIVVMTAADMKNKITIKATPEFESRFLRIISPTVLSMGHH